MGTRSHVVSRSAALRLLAVLRRTASHALVTLLSALVVVLPISGTGSRAHAQSALFESATFAFADQNESAIEHGAASDSGPSLKVRSSPVGASGAYTRTFPIRVPPGRSGMTPALALSYSSASAHKTSAVGAGWSFGAPSISRSTEDGFPKLERGLSYARYSNEGSNTIEYAYHFVDDPEHGQTRGTRVKAGWKSAQWQPILKSIRWGANEFSGTPHQFRLETQVSPYDGDLDMLNGHVVVAGLIDKISVFGPAPTGGIGEAPYWTYALVREVSKDSGRPLLASVVESAGDVQTPRTTRFTYSSNGDLYAERPGTAACAQAAETAFGPLRPLSPATPDLYRTGRSDLSLSSVRPLERLSQAYIAGGYQFRDMDADGDTDVAYLPAGISAPVAQWRKDQSYVRAGDQWVAAQWGTVDKIPSNLLITEFADVDGDGDPDGVSFPLWSIPPDEVTRVTSLTREQKYHYANAYITLNDLVSFAGYVGVGLPGLRLSDGALFRAPVDASVQIVPFAAPSGCVPVRSGPGVDFLSLPVSGPLPGVSVSVSVSVSAVPGLRSDDTTSVPRWHTIPAPDDPREGSRVYPYLPWFVKWPYPWPWRNATNPPFAWACIGPALGRHDFGGSGHSSTPILIGRNAARGSEGVGLAVVDRWPDGVKKWVEPRLVRLPFDPSRAETEFRTLRDFHAPATDLNADGKADLLLLKLRDQSVGDQARKTSFIPRAYLSDGQNFYLDWRKATLPTLAVDLGSLVALNSADVESIQVFRRQVRPSLAGVAPGTRVLPSQWTAPLRPATRSAVRALLSRYSDADAVDPVRTSAFTSSLTKLFEEDLWARHPQPVVGLRTLFERWNGALHDHAWVDPDGLVALVPTNLVPDVDVDLSDLLVPTEASMQVDLGEVLDALKRNGTIEEDTTMATSLDGLDAFLNGALGNAIGATTAEERSGPPHEPYSSFSWSARDILRDGRELDCSEGGLFRECQTHHTYPLQVDANSLPLDVNADGLPDLVVGARPIVIPTSDQPGYTSTACFRGHQVHLNRGYRWDTYDEWATHTTAFEAWSSPSPPTYYMTNKLDGVIFPLEILQNHAGTCGPTEGIDHDLVDLAMIDPDTDTEDTIEGKLRSRMLRIASGATPEWDRTGAAKDAIQTSTLPMAAASFTDVNADGRVDLVFAAEVKRGSRWNVHQLLFLNTGRSFRNVTGVETVGADRVNRSCVLPPDFVMAQFDSVARRTVPVGDRSRLVDVDNDGLVDVVYASACAGQALTVYGREARCGLAQWRRNLRKVPDLLTTVEESTGAWTDIGYVAATSAAAQGTTIARGGTLPAGHMVVSQILRGAQPNRTEWKDLLANAVERVDLVYDNYVREAGRTHSLGFEQVRARFSNSEVCARTGYLRTNCTWKDKVETSTTYDMRASVPGTSVAHPLRGVAVSERTRDVATGDESVTTTTYSVTSLAEGVARIRPELRIASTQIGTVWMHEGDQFLEPDEFGYPQRVIAGRASAAQILADHPETTVTRTEYEQRPMGWHLGRPKATSVEGLALDLQGRAARGVLSRASIAYDAQGRVAATSVLQDTGSECTANAAQWSTTAFPDYNAAGLPTRIEENGRTVHVRYDAAELYVSDRWIDVPASASSPGARLSEALAHDLRHGSLRWHRDMNGKDNVTVFDATGRVLSRTGPDGLLLERHAYNDVRGGPWTVTTERFIDPGRPVASWTALDGYGRSLVTNEVLPTATSSSGFVRSAAERFDGYGRITESYQPRSVAALTTLGLDATDRATRRTFDGFDRLLAELLPDDRVSRHAYGHDATGADTYLMVQSTNPRGFVTRHLYNGHGALARVERLAQADSLPIETYDYTRDGLGRIAQVRDASGTRNVTYDVGGRLVAATLAHRVEAPQRVHQYCFDADGQLTSALTPEGRELRVERDRLGRPARVQVDFVHMGVDGETLEPAVATFMYDCTRAENSLGKLCERADDTGITHYRYDAYGRQAGYELELSDLIAADLPEGSANWFGATFVFGLAGQLKSAVYEGLGTGVHRIDYGHDVVGRTTSITVDDPHTRPRTLLMGAGYDEWGRVVTTTLGNTVTTAWVFDRRSEHLTASKLYYGSAAFAELRYPLSGYDGNGNPGLEERWHNGQQVSDKVHTYDALDQLRTSTVSLEGAVRADDSFSFAGGNLTQAGVGDGSIRYEYEDDSNTQAVTRITGAGLERVLGYDGDGWVSRDTQVEEQVEGATQVVDRKLTYDAGGCLREVVSRIGPDGANPQPTVTRNVCGLSGARAYRETTLANGEVERVLYLPNGAELRPEQDLFIMRLPVETATVAHLAWSVRDGGIVPSESGYVHTDVRGSVIARTPLDVPDVRMADREAEYDAWGRTLAYEGVATPRYQFIDEEPDPGTGYYFFGARAYDASLRRWLSPDPLVMLRPDRGGDTDANLYAYAHNNPVVVTDRTGLLGDTPGSWERGVEDAMVSTATEHPKEYLALGVIAASSGLAAVVLPEAAAGTLIGAAMIGETVVDGMNVIVAAVDLAQNPSLQSGAGLAVATADLVSGLPLPVGDVISGAIINQSAGRHHLSWELRSSSGQIKTRGVEESGGTSPGRRLTWKEQQKVHTEGKALEKAKGSTKPGDVLTMRGEKKACPMCKGELAKAAKDREIKITYEGGGEKKELTSGRRISAVQIPTVSDWLAMTRRQRDQMVPWLTPPGFSYEGPCGRTELLSFREKQSHAVFVLVLGGSFSMGLSPEEYISACKICRPPPLSLSEMRPVHTVTLEPFLLARQPVSIQLAERCLRLDPDVTRPVFDGGVNAPVYLTYPEAEAIAQRFAMGLPSEEQWEYACRAGTRSLFFFGDSLLDEGGLHRLLSTDFNAAGGDGENAFGLQGLFVGEWCSNRWRPTYESKTEPDDVAHVVRGGGAVFWPWEGDTEWSFCVSAMRMPSSDLADAVCALRLARPL